MGMRGINATPKRFAKKRPEKSPDVHPWDEPGLSRAERVLRFVQSLPVTAGPLAGTKLQLRPWQKKFICAVYKDRQGRQAPGAHGRVVGGPQEWQNAACGRPLPMRLVRTGSRTAR